MECEPLTRRAAMLLSFGIRVDMRLLYRVDGAILERFNQPANKGGGHGAIEVNVTKILEKLLMHFVQEMQPFGPTFVFEFRQPAAGEFRDQALNLAV